MFRVRFYQINICQRVGSVQNKILSSKIKEREKCDKIIQELNRTLGNQYGFVLELLTWELNSRPGFGEYSQKTISTQLGYDYHIFIGIMNRKFGTPTQAAASGTEEEFDNAYKRIVNKEDVEDDKNTAKKDEKNKDKEKEKDKEEEKEERKEDNMKLLAHFLSLTASKALATLSSVLPVADRVSTMLTAADTGRGASIHPYPYIGLYICLLVCLLVFLLVC